MLRVLILVMLTSAAMAGQECVCQGKAAVFQQNERFLKVRIEGSPQCEGNSCRLLSGSVHSVYYLESSVRDAGLKQFMTQSGHYLKAKRPGYTFNFVYARSEKDGISTATWEIEPR